MTVKFSNNAWGRITTSLSKTDTRILLNSGEGDRFPSVGVDSGDYFYATLVSNDNTIEIVKCVGRNANVLTVERAQEDTVASEFPEGSRLEHRLTAAAINAKADVKDFDTWKEEMDDKIDQLSRTTETDLSNTVKTTTQDLSEAEQKRARDNIGAASIDEVTGKLTKATAQFDDFMSTANTAFVRKSGDTMSGALKIDSTLTVSGKATAQTFQTSSDRRFKYDLEKITEPEARKLVDQMKAYRFKRHDDVTHRTFAGVVAQEIEKLVPEAVTEDGFGYKSVDYSAITAVLISAVQNLSRRVAILEKKRSS